jgi:poly-beta-1,6-N-acetyl-D-glucosamine synthase
MTVALNATGGTKGTHHYGVRCGTFTHNQQYREPSPITSMETTFWICAMLLAYSYFGYPAVLWVMSRFRRRGIQRATIFPSVSILIAVRNEEANLVAKLDNLCALDYPRELLQMVIVSDGSTDGTSNILLNNDFVTPVILDRALGKAVALNEAVRRAEGDILVFLDARQRADKNAIRELVACLADQEVGAVSGELMLEDWGGNPTGLGLYWKIEKTIRKCESDSGSMVGVTGAIYAMRRELYVEIPPGTILDDVFVPMHVIKQGKRVVFQPSAMAYDSVFTQRRKEFARKVRTLTGNYQLVYFHPWLLV